MMWSSKGEWGEQDVQLYLDTLMGITKSGCRSCGSTDHLSDSCPLSVRSSRDAPTKPTLTTTLTKAEPKLAPHALTNTGVTSPDAQQPTLGKTTLNSPATERTDQNRLQALAILPEDTPNYLSQLTPPTPIDIDRLASYLQGHPDQPTVNHLLPGFSEGFKIGHSGPRAPKEYHNLPGANINPSIIDKNMLEEVTMGNKAGPFAPLSCKTCRYTPLTSFPRNISPNGVPYSTSRIPNTAPAMSTATFLPSPVLCNTLRLTIQLQYFRTSA